MKALITTLAVMLPMAALPQAGTFLDTTLGPQPATGLRLNVPTAGLTADFTFSPGGGSWPLTVQFVDTTQGGPASWAWTFGDGGTSTAQNPIHTFQNPQGTFTVSLTATGPGGSSSTNHSITTTNAIPVDMLLTANYRIGANRIQPCAGYSAGLFYDFVNQRLALYCYDPVTFTHTEAVGNTNMVNAISTSPGWDFVQSSVVFAGQSSFGGAPQIWEFSIATNSKPTSFSYVTNFAFGTSNTQGPEVDHLSNGGLAVVGTEHGTNRLWVAYRTPSGTWKTNGAATLPNLPSPNLPTFVSGAEMPGDNSYYAFLTQDSGQSIWFGKWTISSTDLTFVSNGIIVQGNGASSDPTHPYGEICLAQAISDTSSNRILLAFNNDNFCGPADTRSTGLSICGLTANTNFYNLAVADQTIYRELTPWGISQPATGNKFIWFTQFTCSGDNNLNWPLYIERFSGETIQASSLDVYQVDPTRINYLFHPRQRQFIIQDGNTLATHFLAYP